MQTKPNEINIFIIALLKILGVALVCGVAVGIIFKSIIAGAAMFLMAIVGQFAINSIVMGITSKKNKEAEFLAEQVLKEASERRLPYNLNCAYCNTLNRVGISFINENIFDCSHCQQPNKVFIQFTTTRITTPITSKGDTNFIDMDTEETNVFQTTINDPIVISGK